MAINVSIESLHLGQRKLAEDDSRFQVVAAGRRFGKTKYGVARCFQAAVPGGRAWWVSPSYPMSTVGWRPILNWGLSLPGADPNRAERRVVFPSGGSIQVRSADHPESLRGEGLDLVVVDEAAHMGKWGEVWDQALRPALSDRQGGALFISTPKGLNHFHELHRKAEREEGWSAHQYPTSANPFIDKEEIERAREELPALVFRQEYLAEFVQLEGAMFRREWFGYVEEPLSAHYVRYWDLAASEKTTADFTVGAKAGVTKDGRLCVADVVRGRWLWPDALRQIAQTAKADGPEVRQGIEDVGVQKGMHQLLVREPTLAHLTFRPVPVVKDKITRANAWLARAEQEKVVLVEGAWNTAFLDEICAFPETKHDDQVDAVSGAVQMLGGMPRLKFNWAKAVAPDAGMITKGVRKL